MQAQKASYLESPGTVRDGSRFVFLASNVSSYVGENLVVDGGLIEG